MVVASASAAIFLLATSAQRPPLQLPPIDQCSKDRSFAHFQSDVRRTVGRRDAKALLAILADDVMVDFDGSHGPREFARLWHLNAPRPQRSPVWHELEAVLRLGCARIGPARIMPSLVAQLEAADALETMIALPGAKLRTGVGKSARTAALSYHVVTTEEGGAEEGWIRVRTGDGRHGLVRRDQLRSALQYRAQFERRRGRWRLTSFVEGD